MPASGGAGFPTALGVKVGALGAAALGGLAAMSAAFAKQGDVLEKAGRRTGVSVEALSELKVAAEVLYYEVEHRLREDGGVFPHVDEVGHVGGRHVGRALEGDDRVAQDARHPVDPVGAKLRAVVGVIPVEPCTLHAGLPANVSNLSFSAAQAPVSSKALMVLAHDSHSPHILSPPR